MIIKKTKLEYYAPRLHINNNICVLCLIRSNNLASMNEFRGVIGKILKDVQGKYSLKGV